MGVITTTDEAEAVARQWLADKYNKRLQKQKFTEVMLQDGVWTIRVEGELVKGLITVIPTAVVLKVDATTTNVVGYSESPLTKK